MLTVAAGAISALGLPRGVAGTGHHSRPSSLAVLYSLPAVAVLEPVIPLLPIGALFIDSLQVVSSAGNAATSTVWYRSVLETPTTSARSVSADLTLAEVAFLGRPPERLFSAETVVVWNMVLN